LDCDFAAFREPAALKKNFPASQSLNSGSTEMSPNPMLTEDQRIKALEDQVQLLTQQLSLLHGELTSLREANPGCPGARPARGSDIRLFRVGNAV